MNLLIAFLPLVLVFGLAWLLGVFVARVSAWHKPAITMWAAHPWWWFFASQAIAVIVLIAPSTLAVVVTCVLLVGLPSAVQGLRLAAEHSSFRYWLVVGVGLAFVYAPRLVQSARGLPVKNTLFSSPLIVLAWMLAARTAGRVAPSREQPHEEPVDLEP
jgi:hypothetical protein